MHTTQTAAPEQQHTDNEKNEFEIRTLEWLGTNRRSLFSATSNDAAEIIWIKEGSGIIFIDEQQFVVRNNMLVFLAPCSQRRLQFDKAITGFYISFNVAFSDIPLHQPGYNILLEPCSTASNATVVYYNDQVYKEAVDIILKIRAEFDNHFLFRESVIKSWLQLLTVYLSREFKQMNPQALHQKDAAITRKFMLLLKQNFTHMKMVAAYANELCITPNYLNRAVKLASGHSASYHIQEFVIQQAKRRVNTSGASMKEIAYGLGFDSMAHFSKYFKNKAGLNFTNYKRQQGQ